LTRYLFFLFPLTKTWRMKGFLCHFIPTRKRVIHRSSERARNKSNFSGPTLLWPLFLEQIPRAYPPPPNSPHPSALPFTPTVQSGSRLLYFKNFIRFPTFGSKFQNLLNTRSLVIVWSGLGVPGPLGVRDRTPPPSFF